MKIFICDGTPLSFFTAAFDAFGEENAIITSDAQVQLSLDSEVIRVVSDEVKCGRVLKAIARYERYAEERIVEVLRSCDAQKEQIALLYIKKLAELKAPIFKRLSLPEVIRFNDLAYKITGETHRLKGLLRFMECADGTLYAPYTPDNNITDLLMRHFAARLKNERFVIHDLKRKIAGIYNGQNWILSYVNEAEITLSDREKSFENLWKRYYRAVNIESRPHEKQMKGSMPVRYWKFLPEKQD